MKTSFLLLAQYDGLAIIPLERVCSDYFSHLTPDGLKKKVAAGQIDLPIVRIGSGQKAARGVHLLDLAEFIDNRRAEALKDLQSK